MDILHKVTELFGLNDKTWMRHSNLWSILPFLIWGLLILTGAGCLNPNDRSFPPKPPIPGVQRSPAIDYLTPGN